MKAIMLLAGALPAAAANILPWDEAERKAQPIRYTKTVEMGLLLLMTSLVLGLTLC